MKETLIVVGNGMAGMRTVEELIALAPDRYDITVFGAEPHGNYNRIMLSPVLAGDKSLDEIMIHDEDWYTEHGVTLRKGVSVTTIDPNARTVTTEDGTEATFDKLLLATGSDPIILPLPGVDLPGVVTFRDIKDVNAMVSAAESGKRAVVIGGGLLGLEAANGLQERGMEVTVVHLMETLMERQMDPVSGAMLKQALEERGLAFKMPAETEAILGDDHVAGLRFKDGTEIEADLVVMAVGIRPNAVLAREAGLECGRGVVVDDHLKTSAPDIFAVGECVEHRGVAYGLVAPLYEQGKVCARQLADVNGVAYEGSMTATKLKVTGIDLYSAGDFLGGEGCEDMVFQDPARGVYRKLVLKDDRVVGTVLYGDVTDGSWYFDLMRSNEDVAEMRGTLLFGQAVTLGGDADPAALVAAMSDEAEVCGCNGVTKGDILTAIAAEGLTTLEEVKTYTKASSSCGGCSDKVEQVLAAALGDDYVAGPAVKPLCGCTEYTDDEIREAIAEGQLMTMDAVMRALDWRTPDGCAKCRPALNYYLLCAWPGEYEDHAQSRFVNERVHGNIQKDGSFSVVPRMWGGSVTSDQLRAIADVADRFSVPEVKVTGGQRIDLFGVAKEQLPAMWADLNEAGLISGHAYGKAVRTVKTCIGSRWCRFGTRDSTGLGIRLEELCWGAWTPAKVKLAVSGCPRNCAESTIKDFGVIAGEGAWELHVAGNGGIKVRVTDLLCKVETDEEVLEYCSAFLQLYREEARYGERTAHWVERVGIDGIRAKIVDDAEGRLVLMKRFLASQGHAQVDPWAERAQEGIESHEFTLMRKVG